MKNENARKKKCINLVNPKFVLKRQLMDWGMIISVFILTGSLFLSLFPHNVEGVLFQIESETIFENGRSEDRTPINAELPINFEIEGIKDKNINKDIKIPFSGFIKNLGQLNEENIQYYYSTQDITLGFGPSSIHFISHSHKQLTFSLSFPGSQAINPTGIAESTNKVNYFYGVHQFIDIPTYNEVWYYNLYLGIDLRYYMTNQGLKYDFLVHPGANPNQISIKVSQSMSLNIKSQIVSYWSDASNSPLLQDKSLHVFQSDGIDVSAHFVPKKNIANTYGFQINSFDSTQVLTIDPLLLSFSTFFGGSGVDVARDIAVDSEGNVIIVGTTNATIPILNTFQTNPGGAKDIFVAKLNATGNGLLFSTYLGGSEDDGGWPGIVIDELGNSYITGFTESSDFPVTPNAYNNTYGGGKEVFVTKLNTTGNGLIFSTFLGGNADEWGFKIALDSQGNSYIIGTTYSNDFPITIPSYQSTLRGTSDVFITKLNATGTGLVFSTFLGGSDYDFGRDIAVDDSENCYLLGDTFSMDFPIENGYQNTYGGGISDLFVAKLNATGTGLIYSTYLGGYEDEYGMGLALDSGGNVYLTGETWSKNYPTTANAYQNTSTEELSFIMDAFVTKLNSTGNGLIFSTFLGGTDNERAFDISVDSNGNSYITGLTFSADFPITTNAYDSTFIGGNASHDLFDYLLFSDAFVTKLNAQGSNLGFSTFLGGNGTDVGYGITIDNSENCYVAGATTAEDFPTKNAYDNTHNGTILSQDAFITKFTLDDDPPSITLISPLNNTTNPFGTLIDLDIEDTISGLSHIFYNWDEGINTTLNAPYDVSLPAEEGSHVLSVYANDSAGNWAVRTFVFTTSTPTDANFIGLGEVLITIAVLTTILWCTRRRKNAG